MLAAALGAASQQASAETLHVEIDTTSMSNSGWIDFMFNASNSNAANTDVLLSNFVGFSTATPAETSGSVRGSLAGGYTLSNAAQTAELFHAVNFGSIISFNVEFSGAIGPTINRSLSTLGIALYGPDQTTLLGNGDSASGSLVHLNWLSPTSTTPGSVSTRIFDDVVSVGAVAVSPVPEPSVWLTMGAGLGLLALVRRRKTGGVFNVSTAPALAAA